MITNRKQIRKVQRQIVLWEHLRRRTAHTISNYFKLNSIPLESPQGKVLRGMDENIDNLNGELKEFKSKSVSSVELDCIVSLGKKLIHARSIVNWDQETLAAKVGCHRQQITRFEGNEYATANLSGVLPIAKALKHELERLGY